MALPAPAAKRTEGDGMEHVNNKKGYDAGGYSCSLSANLPSKRAYKLPKESLVSFKPPVVLERKISSSVGNHRTKQPKFVPFEPYKAAVRPIIPNKSKYVLPSSVGGNVRCRSSSCESNVTKVSQASNATDEIEQDVRMDDTKGLNCSKVMELQEEINKLTLENSEMEKELNMQVQINGELRNLLVASVGEDMETRVSCLAEDKLHLAQKLINTAKNLSTHHEQMEWLASQCEVWRSKFLASSVMVEELARWKASLAQKVNEAENIMKRLMEERKHVRKCLLSVHGNLMFLRDNFDILSKKNSLLTSNILDLSAECSYLSNVLVLRLMNTTHDHSHSGIHDLPRYTESETAADYMIKNPHPLSLLGEPDAACKAVVGAAVALHGEMYHQNNPPRITCCPQCSGSIKLV